MGKHLLAGVLLLTTYQVFMKLNCDNINLSLCSCISDTAAIYSLFYWFKLSLYIYMNVIVTDIISY